MSNGNVFWITGLSGAGKTTLAVALQKKMPGSILLDGDALRAALGAEASGFDRESRLNLALTYTRLAKLLADQGFTVIVATISLFHEVLAWNRAHLPGYREIFLDVPEAVRRARDPKGLYQAERNGILSGLAGGCVPVDIPLSPSLVITPDVSLEEAVSAVLALQELGFETVCP
jgi:adenylylsulfate kinase-like enzyme